MKKNYLSIFCLTVFSLFIYTVSGQESDSLLFSQEVNPEIGSGSSVAADGEGYYSAEDFKLNVDATISSMSFPGYQFENNLEETYTGAVLYIYEDDNGIPAGIPGKSGTPYYTLDLDKTDPLLELNPGDQFDYEFTIQTPDLTVEADKIYWVVFAVKIDFAEKLNPNEMWTWYNSTPFNFNDAVNIDPDDFFGSGLTYWLSIYDMTGGVFGDDVRGLSLSIYGEETMGVDQSIFENQIALFPNPTTDKLNIATSQNLTVEHINVYDLAGRLFKTDKNKAIIDVSNLNCGSYFVEINFTNGHKSIKKFLKI
ncbi:MAG: T9SS type A sorting domain-containing protein [Aequorivita sp.]